MTRKFDKFARDEKIADAKLIERIREADRGLVDANLQGCLVKLRIARQGGGKSGGYRAIVAFRAKEKAFYMLGYPKNVRDNLSDEEAKYLDEAGELLLRQDDQALRALMDAGKLRELDMDAKGGQHA